jgi:hypothetical protein
MDITSLTVMFFILHDSVQNSLYISWSSRSVGRMVYCSALYRANRDDGNKNVIKNAHFKAHWKHNTPRQTKTLGTGGPKRPFIQELTKQFVT